MGEIESLVEKGDEKGLIKRLKVYFPGYRSEAGKASTDYAD